jgi:Tetratricopeptide repeat
MTVSVRGTSFPVRHDGPTCRPAFWTEADSWVESLKELVSLDPNRPISCNMLGDCYLKSGNEKLAIECFDKALSHDPANDNIDKICDIVHPVFCGDRCFRNLNGPSPGLRKRIRGLRYKCPLCPPLINGCDRRYNKRSSPCGDVCSGENLEECRLHPKSRLLMIPSENWLRSNNLIIARSESEKRE